MTELPKELREKIEGLAGDLSRERQNGGETLTTGNTFVAGAQALYDLLLESGEAFDENPCIKQFFVESVKWPATILGGSPADRYFSENNTGSIALALARFAWSQAMAKVGLMRQDRDSWKSAFDIQKEASNQLLGALESEVQRLKEYNEALSKEHDQALKDLEVAAIRGEIAIRSLIGDRNVKEFHVAVESFANTIKNIKDARNARWEARLKQISKDEEGM